MRNQTILRPFAGAASLALAAILLATSPAAAFAGLSDRQKAHIEEYIHCKILLLTDLAAFEAEQPPCGGKPRSEWLTPTGDGVLRLKVREQEPCEYAEDEGEVLARVALPSCDPQPHS